MITRRGLLSGILAAGVAPWVVKAGVLMPVKQIVLPEWGIGIPEMMRAQIIERNALIREMIDYGNLKMDILNHDRPLAIYRKFHPGPNGGIIHTDQSVTLNQLKRLVPNLTRT